MIVFTVHGTPQPAGSKRMLPAGGRAGGRMIVVDDNPKGRAWKRDVATVARAAMDGQPPLTGPLRMELVFRVERPQRHFGARGLRASAPPWPTVRPDVLKLARAVEDALTGIVYGDDAQVVAEHLVKLYGAQPGVYVQVDSIDTSHIDAMAAAVAGS